MPNSTQRDRTPTELEISRSPWPAPPLNVFMRGVARPGIFDLSWDNPGQLARNSRFILFGVNIYRSFDSEFGPYERVTEFPVGSGFWRDMTNNVLIEEDVSNQWVLFGVTSGGDNYPRYVFKTQRPIVKSGSQMTYANAPSDVMVFVDGTQVPVLSVLGQTGEVEIDIRQYPDVSKQTYFPTVVPTTNSRVTCFYRYTKDLLKTDLITRIFWMFTTVGLPIEKSLESVQSTDLVETPIKWATATNSLEVEKEDYIWREAIRRNRFLLEQGGERVKVFLRKTVGITCPCIPDDHHKQPINDDPICFGTGIVGGYDGPYDIIISPDDGEKRIAQKEFGRTVEHTYETWTSPTPLLSHRDFIVKINGERYSIGAVRMPSNRGIVLQQHFTIGHFDEKDIRYRVSIDKPVPSVLSFDPSGPEQEASSKVTDKPNIPEDRQLRGRTLAWQNITYG